jgi:hypothetical protein
LKEDRRKGRFDGEGEEDNVSGYWMTNKCQ